VDNRSTLQCNIDIEEHAMPRTGGEADKLGNRFEGVRIAGAMLGLLTGDAVALTVEPFGPDALGVEFVKETPDGVIEFHSVKRQTTDPTWTLHDLTETGSTGRSILGDLFGKLSTHDGSRVVFVSATTANKLNEICDRALRSDTVDTFAAHLDASPSLRRDFDKCILPLCGHDGDMALGYLKRTEVVGITEAESIRHLEQQIRYALYRSDNNEVRPLEVRLLLGEFIYARLGQVTRMADVASFLRRNDYRQRGWGRDTTIRERVTARNALYLRQVEAELIQGIAIARPEAAEALDALKTGGKHRVVVVGTAGLGKSCAFAQVLRQLERDGIPVLALRMDVQAQVLTAHGLGKAMDFPMSPTLVLAGIANGGRCVLAIDQLDALSHASGRNPHLWAVFEELIAECERLPNMRVLLACRAFDAEHDARLRRLIADELSSLRIDLDLLTPELVREIIGRAGIEGRTLKDKEVELLRTPLHLSLYLQGDPSAHPSFVGVQELFARYWETKHKLIEQKLGRTARWTDAIRLLSGWLSEHQTLSAPKDILDELQGDIEAMASEHVLVFDDNTCRFFHEVFFDYAFARTFVAGSGHVLDLLLTPNESQHLFRRAQVRQILGYQRGREQAAYLEDLRRVLTEPRVRFHIKRLVLDWLRSLDDPMRAEWQLLQSLAGDASIGNFVRLVPHYSVPWFDLLHDTGTWASWLGSDDEPTVNHALWLLSLPPVMKARSAQVAALISPHLDKGGIWQKRFLTLISFGEVYHSREMFDLFVNALRSGWIDVTKGQLFWHHFHAMPKDSPRLAAKLLGEYFDHICRISPTKSPFQDIGNHEALPANFVPDLEKSDPESLVCQLLPRVVREVQARMVDSTDDWNDRDHLWPYISLHQEYDFKSTFLPSLGRCLATLAVEKPETFEQAIQGMDSLRSRTIAFLLLHGWRANPPRYADKAIEYMLADNRRLAMGYDAVVGEGQITAAIGRATLKDLAPRCSAAVFGRLEATILTLRDNWEQENPKRIGYKNLLLLESLPIHRMSAHAVATFEQLQRKFPKADFSQPRASGASFVGSPIPVAAMQKMTDAQWLSAMRKYSRRRESQSGFRGGGLHQLTGDLEHAAQNEKPRFSALTLKMGDDVAPEYFDAILRGIVKVDVDKQQEGRYGPGAPMPLDTASLVAVIRRVHELPNHPSGRGILWAVYQSVHRDLPDSVFEIVTHYALHDPDPEKELWQVEAWKGKPYFGGDPTSAGINSVRGAAADAIARLLFADKSRWTKCEVAVNHLVQDESLAVRACTVECLTALLNLNRDRAVDLFLLLCEKADAILGSHSVDTFLHYAFYSHYTKLRSLTLQMLASQQEALREIASRQIAVAAFGDSEAQSDLAAVLAGDEKCRAAAADVFARNLGHVSIREACRKHLTQHFHDQSAKVRDTASRCFRQLSDAQLAEECDLIFAFVQSPAFPDGCDDLLFKLKESKDQLPDVVLAVADRAISLHPEGEEQRLKAGHASYYLPELVLRVYDQTSDPGTKNRCLDLIDEMLRVGFSSIDTELAKVER
jgi:hypothetical protein